MNFAHNLPSNLKHLEIYPLFFPNAYHSHWTQCFRSRRIMKLLNKRPLTLRRGLWRDCRGGDTVTTLC